MERVRCVKCDITFEDLQQFAKHLLDVHFCYECLAEFSTDQSCFLHCLIKHGGDKPACSQDVVCGFAQCISGMLNSSAVQNVDNYFNNLEGFHSFLSNLWTKFVKSSLTQFWTNNSKSSENLSVSMQISYPNCTPQKKYAHDNGVSSSTALNNNTHVNVVASETIAISQIKSITTQNVENCAVLNSADISNSSISAEEFSAMIPLIDMPIKCEFFQNDDFNEQIDPLLVDISASPVLAVTSTDEFRAKFGKSSVKRKRGVNKFKCAVFSQRKPKNYVALKCRLCSATVCSQNRAVDGHVLRHFDQSEMFFKCGYCLFASCFKVELTKHLHSAHSIYKKAVAGEDYVDRKEQFIGKFSDIRKSAFPKIKYIGKCF